MSVKCIQKRISERKQFENEWPHNRSDKHERNTINMSIQIPLSLSMPPPPPSPPPPSLSLSLFPTEVRCNVHHTLGSFENNHFHHMDPLSPKYRPRLSLSLSLSLSCSLFPFLSHPLDLPLFACANLCTECLTCFYDYYFLSSSSTL